VKRPRLRSRLITAAAVISVALAWWFLAPTQIGGSTRYVVTSGVSMEPRFHTGDLAIVRPADSYKVGEIVAYRSTLLHTVVLHRIIAVNGDLYTFKGDNNDFIDPVRPTRSELLGKLWLHIPHGGVLLRELHTPVVAAIFVLVVCLLFWTGAGETRRRRKRHRQGATGIGRQGAPPVNIGDHGEARPINYRAPLIAAAAAVVVFFALTVVMFTRPAHRPSVTHTPYTQGVSFSYSAAVRPGLVYPDGAVKTGDPIFLSLVHRLGIGIDYRLTSGVPHSVGGTEDVLLRLTGPGGWSRTMVLVPPTRFKADNTQTQVSLNLLQLQSLLAQVARLTGVPSYSGYTIAVVPEVNLTGTVGGHPIKTSFKPMMNLQLGTVQLQPSASNNAAASQSSSSAPATTASSASLSANQSTAVATPSSSSNTVTFFGASLPVPLMRWLSVLGLLVSIAGAAVLWIMLSRAPAFAETVRIQSKYGHLIVPIVAADDLGWPPVDVPSIKSLVRLAESGQRLILHNRTGDVDTYLVNEEGTVYRYQVQPAKVVWGDWSEPEAVKAAA
jgi:signal peptidase I